jgi:hypothetical protein
LLETANFVPNDAKSPVVLKVLTEALVEASVLFLPGSLDSNLSLKEGNDTYLAEVCPLSDNG